MAQHPPTPGPIVSPNFLPVSEALATVAFPISKRELLEHVGEETVLLRGRNASLHDLIKDVHDDHFESEEELMGAIEAEHAALAQDETDGDIMVIDEQKPEGNPKSIEDGIREAARDKTGEHLQDDTPAEPGKPEAVNLEREEPVTNAARRRDSFERADER